MDLSSTKIRSNIVITIGFSTIIVFLMILLALWITTVFNNEKILNEIADAQLETRQISTMRDAALRRAMALHRMGIMYDPFEQQEELEFFRDQGSTFLQIRDEMLSKPKSIKEMLVWDEIRENLNQGGRAQNEALNLIIDEENIDAANKILVEKVVPIQDKFLAGMTNLLDIERTSVEQKLAEVAERNKTTYWLIGLCSSVALFLFFFTIYVVRKTGRTEEALVSQGKRIRELYEVSSRPGLDLDEQIIEMLKLGSRLLDQEIARVCKINTDAKTNTFLYVHAPDHYGIKKGKIIPLDKSFCSITYSNENGIAVNDISHSQYAHTPYHEFSQLESYIAARIHLHGEDFGTVNFSSRFPRKEAFTDTDRDLVNLIGSWVSLALERQYSQDELFKAKENAEAANMSKSAFLANMSHELRTPLNAIIGYSELIAEDINNKNEDAIETDLNRIAKSGHHLLSLINDVLDLSKIEAGKMALSIKEADITTITKEVIDTFKPSLNENNNEIVANYCEKVSSAPVDPTRLRQTLINLIGNAIKFTKNGKITIELDHKLRYGKEWSTISVSDNGIGIPQEAISKIFQPFQQVSKETSIKYGGTGLGLAISQRMCRMMGGDITVVSCPDEGSTFTVWLPLDQSNNQNNEAPARVAQN